MGGETRLVRQRERGRLNARERIAALFDPGSFSEIGQLVGANEDPPVASDALVAGSGRIQGRPALAGFPPKSIALVPPGCDFRELSSRLMSAPDSPERFRGRFKEKTHRQVASGGGLETFAI